MFQFSGLSPYTYLFQYTVTGYDSRRVAPFGYLRIIACLRLPEAFRSLPRPSSTLGAKASTVRSYYLDLPAALAAASRCLRIQIASAIRYLACFCFSYVVFKERSSREDSGNQTVIRAAIDLGMHGFRHRSLERR